MSKTKILIIGPAWVGDMVMAQTLFRLLKAQNPAVLIDVIAPRSTHPLLARMPEVNQAIVLPLRHGEFNLRQRRSIGHSLRSEKYDQAILLSNTFKSALIPWFAQIPVRTGWRREMRQCLLNDCRVLDKAKYPLMIERFMALGLAKNAALPDNPLLPRFEIDSQNVKQALDKLNLSLPEKPVLALCPGAEFGPAKRWPETHYAEVANHYLQAGWDVWIFGGPKDQSVAVNIQALTRQACFDLTGKTTLPEAVDLLSLAKAVVSNDSGLMHIAAALQRPLVVVYGSSSPEFTPPLSDRAKIISLHLECSPCFQRECPLGHLKCLRDLMPKTVVQALEKLSEK